ncbi:unnamed protein product [Rotaria sp. Silwood1]|nr:unnamed protein product [Rotaria sp. Silwood1]
MAIAMMVVSVNADGLRVKILSVRSRFSKKQDVVVNVQYNNTNNETIYIYKWCLPDNELHDPLFKVTCNDVPVDYLGPLIKRRTQTDDDVTPLEPGKTKVTLVQLSSAYDMSKTCNYSIQYKIPTERVIFKRAQTLKTIHTEPINNRPSEIESNNIQLTVEGRSNIQHEQGNIMNVHKRAVTSYVSCSTSQKDQLAVAVPSALQYASNSFNYLSTTTFSGTNRYKTWFGTYTSGNWNTLKGHYQNIKNVLSSQAITLNCGCTKSDAYAYVYPNQPYKIYLCPLFWSASTTGTDSKAGTLVHEISHFTAVAGTQDYVYGQMKCKSLAVSSSSQALMNADSHEYFTENNPALS